MNAEYELFALRYATREARRHEHFIGGDPHDGPMPMDYFVWVAKNADRAVVIDIGFTAESGGRRGRRLERCPIDSLALLDVDPARVEDVILTHMHYDHVGNFHKFPKARFHLQEPEMHYAVGRHMRHKQLAKSFEPDDVCGIVRLNFEGRVNITMARPMCCPGSASCRPADIPSGCSSSASTRDEARSFWRRMSRISTRTWRLTGRSPPPFISATCWTRSIRCAPMHRRRGTSFRDTIRK